MNVIAMTDVYKRVKQNRFPMTAVNSKGEACICQITRNGYLQVSAIMKDKNCIHVNEYNENGDCVSETYETDIR